MSKTPEMTIVTDGRSGTLPTAVMEWAGLCGQPKVFGPHPDSDGVETFGELSQWNDWGLSFAELADLIEGQL